MTEAPAAPPDETPAPVRSLRHYILPGLAILTGFVIALIIWLVLSAPLGRALELGARALAGICEPARESGKVCRVAFG